MEDSDAPGGTFTHWIVFNIPSDVLELAEGTPKTPTLTNGAVQGTNDFAVIGYRGPDPPLGENHHYLFRIYALDTTLNLEPGVSRSQVINAINGHILGQVEYGCMYYKPGLPPPQER
jgi:Raf kinase inhibitor-like YbhB/YbcL family protein